MQADADWTANKRISHLWRVARRRHRHGAAHLGQGRRIAAALVARRQVDCVCRQARRRRDRADPPAADRRRRGPGADHPRHRRQQPGVVARRPAPLLPGRGRQVGRADGAREGQGRRLRLRREHPACATCGGSTWRRAPRRGSPPATSRCSPTSCRPTAAASPTIARRAPVLGDADRGEVWVMDADGGNAADADQEHGGRKRRQPVARRRAGPVPVGLERAVRDLLQRQPVRDAVRRRHGARPDPRLRQRDHRRRLVEGRPRRSTPSPTWACTASSTRSRPRAARRRR